MSTTQLDRSRSPTMQCILLVILLASGSVPLAATHTVFPIHRKHVRNIAPNYYVLDLLLTTINSARETEFRGPTSERELAIDSALPQRAPKRWGRACPDVELGIESGVQPEHRRQAFSGWLHACCRTSNSYRQAELEEGSTLLQ